MTTPQEIRDHVEQDFAGELQAARALDKLTDRLLNIWSTEGGFKADVDRIVGLQVARGTTSYKAVLHLVHGGFGKQGLMINRSMFEGMAVAHWVAANPVEALARFYRSGDYSIHKNREQILQLDSEAPADLPGEITGEALRQAIADFGRHNERPWTGHRNLWELVNAVEDQWDEPGRTGLRLFLSTHHQQSNQEMHGGVLSLVGHSLGAESLRDGVRGTTLRVGAGPDDIDDALMGAFFIQANLLGLLASHFGLGDLALQDLQRVTEENQYAFAVVTAADVRDVGRNDLCPCGSKRKFKNCHIDQVR